MKPLTVLLVVHLQLEFTFYSKKNMEDIIKKIDSRQKTAGFEPLCVIVYRDNSFGISDIKIKKY
jgi:hypothetical protein